MIDISWRIDNMERDAITDGVTMVHWRVNANEDNYSSTAYGSVGFTPNPDDPDFIQFADLTQDICLSWVVSSLGEDEVASIEDGLVGQIEIQKNPKTLEGFPWE